MEGVVAGGGSAKRSSVTSRLPAINGSITGGIAAMQRAQSWKREEAHLSDIYQDDYQDENATIKQLGAGSRSGFSPLMTARIRARWALLENSAPKPTASMNLEPEFISADALDTPDYLPMKSKGKDKTSKRKGNKSLKPKQRADTTTFMSICCGVPDTNINHDKINALIGEDPDPVEIPAQYASQTKKVPILKDTEPNDEPKKARRANEMIDMVQPQSKPVPEQEQRASAAVAKKASRLRERAKTTAVTYVDHEDAWFIRAGSRSMTTAIKDLPPQEVFARKAAESKSMTMTIRDLPSQETFARKAAESKSMTMTIRDLPSQETFARKAAESTKITMTSMKPPSQEVSSHTLLQSERTGVSMTPADSKIKETDEGPELGQDTLSPDMFDIGGSLLAAAEDRRAGGVHRQEAIVMDGHLQLRLVRNTSPPDEVISSKLDSHLSRSISSASMEAFYPSADHASCSPPRGVCRTHMGNFGSSIKGALSLISSALPRPSVRRVAPA